jgi:hypothetical protein
MAAADLPSIATDMPTRRIAAGVGIAGVSISIVQSLGIVSGFLTDSANVRWNTLGVLANLGGLALLFAFARSGAAPGWPFRVGLALSFTGIALFALSDIVGLLGTDAAAQIHPISDPLNAVGMIMTGIAVLRAHRWTSPARYTPLVCGLMPFVVVAPALITLGGEDRSLHWFIGSVQIAYLAFALAVWRNPLRGNRPAAV